MTPTNGIARVSPAANPRETYILARTSCRWIDKWYSDFMSNPEKILRELDRHLHGVVDLILYGRGALSLAFPDYEDWSSTMDIDVIIPTLMVETFDMNSDFWNGLEKTNSTLCDEGLYLTHLFLEEQVILSKDWRNHCKPIRLPGLRNLNLSRPAIEDLILTKMMRIDPQDRADIRKLAVYVPQQKNWADIFASAIVPDVPEIREAFNHNQEWFRSEVLG
ncbi:MAG: hypothetical protein JJU29_09720 [Verrucomicrobia bacterium]|nr:hypothetical protein [Verrucomicrobiota bacterium]MCH8511530.1 hypothetical protein [Kiritimatiellia bacterium]